MTAVEERIARARRVEADLERIMDSLRRSLEENLAALDEIRSVSARHDEQGDPTDHGGPE